MVLPTAPTAVYVASDAEPGYLGADTAKGEGNFGVRGIPGGDCFLRFSRER